jgi:hypothetical protein
MQFNNIVWLSVDPVRRKVDFYPKEIAKRIEKVYQDYYILQNKIEPICVLGKDFFNATINLNNRHSFNQTTPGFSMGRAGYKQPGFRSIRRRIVPEDKTIEVFSFSYNGEWRITDNVVGSEIKFTEIIPNNSILTLNDLIDQEFLTYWNPEDLKIIKESQQLSEHTILLNKNIIVWQWCFGVKEKQGDLIKLDDKWWIPYLYEQNKQIEEAFNNKESTIIQLPFDESERKIVFNNNSCFGWQKDLTENKVRIIRRTIITIAKLIELLENFNNKPIDPSELTKYIDESQIPHEFYCCISQDIMKDPVKTIDGFTYDRESIEKWFSTSYKSPLTGINLTSKQLITNYELKKQIDEFIKCIKNN